MKEVEILVELLTPIEDARAKLGKSLRYNGDKVTHDVYFQDPLRDDLKMDSSGKLWKSFRLRHKNGVNSVAYKVDNYDGEKWIYSDEYETVVESFDIFIEIINRLGLIQLVSVHNTKSTYENDDYEIVIEDVENLGYFLEVEYKHPVSDDDVIEVKSNIQRFIDSLGLSVGVELNSGKPELLLNKINGK